MKKYQAKSKQSSPMVLVIPLAIAFVVILAAAMFGRIRTENRSRASYSGLQQCTAACNTTGRAAAFIKDKAACALDCPAVIAKTMTCAQFCTENVKAASGTNTNPTTGAERDWSSQEVCRKQCNQWVNAGGESPTPTIASTPGTSVSPEPTETPREFNCSTKCQDVPGSYGPLCTLVCNQFNKGKRTCPSGCNLPNQQMKNTCMALFCSGQ